MPPVPLDPDGLHQVIMNLLSNAARCGAADGGAGPGRLPLRAEEKSAYFEVIDNGKGIPPSMMKHMFELFHSTKGNRGTGLGLAVAKKIVDEHDGSISVRSTEGEGTTFTIRLPVFHLTMGDPSHTHGPAK